MDSVDGTTAVLTGAGSGIGRATAHALARRGSTVVVSDLDVERARGVAEEIEGLGGRAEGVRCDVSLQDDLTSLAELVARNYGRADLVMSNVGVIAKGDPLEIPMDAWASMVWFFLPHADLRLDGIYSWLGAPPAGGSAATHTNVSTWLVQLHVFL